MRAALKLLMIAGLMAGAACHKQEKASEQNVSIDTSGNIPEGADIETLPPDESSGDSANELEAGEDNPDVNDVNASANSY